MVFPVSQLDQTIGPNELVKKLELNVLNYYQHTPQ